MNSLLNDHCLRFHKLSKDAGWWPKDVSPELVSTKLMLVVTELSEAYDGQTSGANDNHLPHWGSFPIELADARIRIFDLCGQQGIEIAKYAAAAQPIGLSLMDAVGGISAAMEGHRKGNKEAMAQGLGYALHLIDLIGASYGFDIEAATDAKAEYNLHRADHKPEARAAAGGKKL